MSQKAWIRTPPWTLVPGVAVLVVSLAALGLLRRHTGMDPYDLRVYLMGGSAWLDNLPVFQTDVQNQSLNGVILRLTGSSTVWLLAALVVAVGGLWVARSAHRVDPLAGVLAAAVTGLLLSPLSWHEHWGWILPVGVWLGIVAWRLAPSRPVVAGFVPLPVLAFLMLPIPSAPGRLDAASILSPARSMWMDGDHSVLVAAAGATYVLVGLGLLAAGGWYLTRHARETRSVAVRA